MSRLRYSSDSEIQLGAVQGVPRYDVREFAISLVSRNIPMNFMEIVTKTSSFRDALLNYITSTAGKEDAARINETLSLGVKGTEGLSVAAYAELLAALAYAFDDKELAMDAISRTNPQIASSFIKSTAQALNKDMPSDVYKRMLIDSTATSLQLWESVEKDARYPGM